MMNLIHRVGLLIVLLMVVGCERDDASLRRAARDASRAVVAVANEGQVVESPTDADAEPIPPALTHYKGREIATTMHWMGAEWLTRETRDNEEHTSVVVEQLRLKPGMTVCDLGCGNGYYTLKLAQAVAVVNDEADDADAADTTDAADDRNDAGEGDAKDDAYRGLVFAVEIQEEYFGMLEERAQEAGLTNINLVLGTLIDPNLPEASCDIILLVDVYHEFSHPEHMLKAIRKALKPDGVLVLLEFRAEDPKVPIKRLHKMSKAQIMKEIPPNGYKLVRQFDDLPWQHMMFFARDDSELKEIEVSPR